MYMAYTNNPNLPRVRYEAVRLVQSGWSARKVARHLGFAHNTVLNWLKQKPRYGKHGALVIATRSSRPHSHPKQLSGEIVSRILELRRERNQCAEILHHRLQEEEVFVSLSSVKRVLRRYGVSRYSVWKKWHQYPPRPLPSKPGLLVQVDTVWIGKPEERLYVYTLLDVCSRWGYAWACQRINTFKSVQFLGLAKKHAPFVFSTLQSDHGSEFSRRFTTRMKVHGVAHRHSRVRTPNDNAHLERFNRTLQQECLHRIPRNIQTWKKELPAYLKYYNEERPHMGLNYQTPMQVVRSY